MGNAGIEKWNAELVARLPFWASWRWCTHLLPILLRHLPVAQPVRGEGMFHLLACEVHACNTRMCVPPGRRRRGEAVRGRQEIEATRCTPGVRRKGAAAADPHASLQRCRTWEVAAHGQKLVRLRLEVQEEATGWRDKRKPTSVARPRSVNVEGVAQQLLQAQVLLRVQPAASIRLHHRAREVNFAGRQADKLRSMAAHVSPAGI